MPATITFGAISLATPLVLLLGILLTLVLMAAFSFASRGIVYDLVMPAPKLRSTSRRTGARR